jgi:hypothetical protein
MSNDLVEIFGFAATDVTKTARKHWKMGSCPFILRACTKENHDSSVIYGTCSVTSTKGDVVICPNRFYEKNYTHLRSVSDDCFPGVKFMMYNEFLAHSGSEPIVVALGHNSGKEVKLSQHFSMDWILALIIDGHLIEYTGIEVQSIDITNNYRDAWYSYRDLEANEDTRIVASEHGLNWANVHKRIIPQLIRKGAIFARSSLVKTGMHFIVPEVVYQKFEDVIGSDIPLLKTHGPGQITVRTYELSPPVSPGKQRELLLKRKIHFSLNEFSRRFVEGPSFISGEDLDNAVKRVLRI